jgi:pimeloyl-ACP methyl ester carboxylesterase
MAETVSDPVTFGLVHGAWHGAWCWQDLEHELRGAGHNTIAVDLPIDDPNSTYDDHSEIVAAAVEDRENVVLVGHSRGGNIIPRVAGLVAVERLVFLCGAFHASLTKDQVESGKDAPPSAMPNFSAGIIPVRNNLASYDPAKARYIFYQDCSDEKASWAISQLRLQRRAPERRLEEWPDTPSDYILCQDDRVINVEWSRYAARHWLNTEAIELPGGHAPFLSRPQLLASTLMALAERPGNIRKEQMSEKYFTIDDLTEFSDATEAEALAKSFARYLTDYRKVRTGVYRLCDISVTPPDIDPGYVRLPHIVAFQKSGTIADEVMWEKLPRQQAEQWLGSELPDQQFVEEHLPDLQALRVKNRANQLQDERYGALNRRLRGRYLSILFVYQNIDLFADMWR